MARPDGAGAGRVPAAASCPDPNPTQPPRARTTLTPPTSPRPSRRYDDDGDEELLKLLPFLERVAHAGVADVRPHIQRRYRLRSLVEAAADPDAELYQHHYQQQGQQQAQAEQAEAPQAATEAAAP